MSSGNINTYHSPDQIGEAHISEELNSVHKIPSHYLTLSEYIFLIADISRISQKRSIFSQGM